MTAIHYGKWDVTNKMLHGTWGSLGGILYINQGDSMWIKDKSMISYSKFSLLLAIALYMHSHGFYKAENKLPICVYFSLYLGSCIYRTSHEELGIVSWFSLYFNLYMCKIQRLIRNFIKDLEDL